MESHSHALIAGLFVILLGLCAIAGAVLLGQPAGPAQLPVDLLTTHSVEGLKVDAPVRLRGVDVGSVESIAFDAQQPNRIRVRVAVDPSAPITRGTYAELSTQGISGIAFIQLDDEPGQSNEPLPRSAGTIPEMELRPGLFEQAGDSLREVLAQTQRVAGRLEEVLSDRNQQRLLALVDSVTETSARYGKLAHDLEPITKALPGLIEKTAGVADNLSELGESAERRLVLLDTLGQAANDLHNDTLPRVNTLLDEVSIDARELRGTLRRANASPQSFIFGVAPPPPGPGERGFVATQSADK
ncbi:MlaD family protein [Steroidobacter cummioxidans]|uniref:MlaD family protein n=1 Tax=Steroidobacter cummioxidans TaxID=1803913 RepID=UPI00137A72B1|nr:MlaD family protein [Steroidobacter cummioxidans]